MFDTVEDIYNIVKEKDASKIDNDYEIVNLIHKHDNIEKIGL